MKYIIFLLTIILTISVNAQTIKKGDNLKTEFQKIEKPYFFDAPNFTGFAEGQNLYLIGEKENPLDCDFLFIAQKDTTLIGVYKVKKPISFFFDTEGNSILNSSSDFFVLPLWTVKNKTKVSSSDKRIISLFDKLYEKTLQANNNELDEKTIREYQAYQKDTTLANRHIALLFDNYQNIITETAAKGKQAPAEICIPILKSLSEECLKLYNTIPVIVCVYMGEALQSAGMTEEARNHFKMSLQFYPNSIPLMVYNYKLEQDETKKQQLFKELKKKYSKHWMVKDL